MSVVSSLFLLSSDMSHSYDEQRLSDLILVLQEGKDREADESFIRESNLSHEPHS